MGSGALALPVAELWAGRKMCLWLGRWAPWGSQLGQVLGWGYVSPASLDMRDLQGINLPLGVGVEVLLEHLRYSCI